MIEKRTQAQRFLMQQLHKIPVKIRNENITAEQIRTVLKDKLEFEELRNWLKSKSHQLQFSLFHIGGKMDFLILYFILEHEDDEKKHIFGNKKIFQKEAQKACLQLIDNADVTNIEEIKLEEYVEIFRKKWKKQR